MSTHAEVRAWTEEIALPTFMPAAPDKNPMFLEKRVYQGSSGKVYPLPFIDRIAERPVERAWKAVFLENDYLRVMVLPELGGRIHRIQDKTNGYDLIYYQPVIKPALVGLAGPWISGGIEFNWPQHHRPATFLPVDFEIEEHADGSKTAWCSDHDPMCRMKGMHGVCLHPRESLLELKVRAYNRTPFAQTFLWWANVATRVHEAYQNFFPPDVYYVADHARRSMSEYPLAKGHYYGVDYGRRGRNGVPKNEIPGQFVPAHSGDSAKGQDTSPASAYAPNDLSFYANIPVPTSYMCMGSQEDFFGGYDYKAQAGILHIANHHVSPGKKQWTWGNHEFGYAWDRNLTEPDANGEYGPYIEIMAGVYTDNQPDFSFLQPGETKTWSQFWYPIQQIGPAEHANVQAAVSLGVSVLGEASPNRRNRGGSVKSSAVRLTARLGVAVTRKFSRARVLVTAKGNKLFSRTQDLSPDSPLIKQIKLPSGIAQTDLGLKVTDAEGQSIISFQPKTRVEGEVPPPATEPAPPGDIPSTDELFLTGVHLEQYRHATRSPVPYWREALRRDPLDSRSNNAMGLWHLRRGEFVEAEHHFRQAIERLTRRNPNPHDGEPFYNLGLCLRYQFDSPLDSEPAYSALFKATWNEAWASAAYHALAELDCSRSDWTTALDHLDRSLRSNTDNLRARDLKAVVLRKLNRNDEALALLAETLRLDPLDWWARHLAGQPIACDLQTCLDLAQDYARAGLCREAIALLEGSVAIARQPDPRDLGALPLIHYTLGWLHNQCGNTRLALAAFKKAAALPPDYCFPVRLEEIKILESAMKTNPRDPRAPYYLGNLFYDRRRHVEAIELWEHSTTLDPTLSVVWRNLGIGYFNVCRQPAKARAAYDRAFKTNPADARLLFERDQLWKRLGLRPARRLRALEQHPRLVAQRDDLSVELCALYNQTGHHDKALVLLNSRHFQPWEGGEGGPLAQYVRAHLALGGTALVAGNPAQACQHFTSALTVPRNLGEAKHLLANQGDIHYWLACALNAFGETTKAREHWRVAASFTGDFQDMSVRTFSEMTYYSALAWQKLGRRAKARKLLLNLLGYAQRLGKLPAKIDYFATSLPAMLLFEDDLQARQETTALFLQAQALLGLGRCIEAKTLLNRVLKRDPNHPLAADLLGELVRSMRNS